MTQVAEVHELETTILKLQKELDIAKNKMVQIQSKCAHKWSEVKYDPIVHKGGYDPGDTPGTMGIDFRGPSYYSGTTIPQWSRVCENCTKKQTTQCVKEMRVPGKIPGTVAKEQVPQFYED